MEVALLFFNSFMTGFSGAIMPGPLLALDIAETPRYGWRTGPIITTGHAFAEFIMVVLLSAGVATIINREIAARIIAVAGGAMLLLMGGMMFIYTVRNRISYDPLDRTANSQRWLMAKGIGATVSNPYWFVWWATIGLALLVKSGEVGPLGPVIFYFGHILSDYVWYTIVSILLWRGRHVIMGRSLRILIAACALFLVYLGGSFMHDGLTDAL